MGFFTLSPIRIQSLLPCVAQTELAVPRLEWFGVVRERAARSRSSGAGHPQLRSVRSALLWLSSGNAEDGALRSRSRQRGEKNDSDSGDPQEPAIFKPLLSPALKKH